MLFNLLLPEVERLAFWNPLRRPTDIGKDELNKTIVPPQFG
jgi:hypothetical protein